MIVLCIWYLLTVVSCIRRSTLSHKLISFDYDTEEVVVEDDITGEMCLATQTLAGLMFCVVKMMGVIFPTIHKFTRAYLSFHGHGLPT